MAGRGPRQGGRTRGRPDGAHRPDREAVLQEAAASAPDRDARSQASRRLTHQEARRHADDGSELPGGPDRGRRGRGQGGRRGQGSGRDRARARHRAGRDAPAQRPGRAPRGARRDRDLHADRDARHRGRRQGDGAARRSIRRDEERMAKFLDAELVRLVKDVVRREIPREQRVTTTRRSSSRKTSSARSTRASRARSTRAASRSRSSSRVRSGSRSS